MDLRDKVRSIKDFPKEGIIFRDVTTIFKDPEAFHQLMDEMAATLEGLGADALGINCSTPALCRCASRASCLRKPFLTAMIWNTVPIQLKSTRTQFGPA